MSPWDGDPSPLPMLRPQGLGWIPVALRLAAFALVLFGLLGPMLLARMLGARALARGITQLACRLSMPLLGLGFRVRGVPMANPGAMVANHSSWLDIFVLNAAATFYFVAKDDVANWPLIGIFARGTQTVFIERRRSDTPNQRTQLEARMAQGDRVLFFPEATTTNGQLVIPFKSSMFAAYTDSKVPHVAIQPVSVRYTAPPGQDPRCHSWWEDTPFAAHLFHILALPRGGRVDVILHPPLLAADFEDRKALMRATEQSVQDGFERLG